MRSLSRLALLTVAAATLSLPPDAPYKSTYAPAKPKPVKGDPDESRQRTRYLQRQARKRNRKSR